MSPASPYSSGVPHVQRVPPRPHDLTVSPGSPASPVSPVSHCLPRAPIFSISHHVPSDPHVPKVLPCTQGAPPTPRAPVSPVPGMCPHLGTPAQGLPSDAPGTGSRCGPRSRAGTGTAPSPAAKVTRSAGQRTGHRAGSGAVPGCGVGLTTWQAGCRACVGWQPQGSQPPGPPRLQKWGAQRSQLLPTTLGRQAQAPVPWSQVQVPVAQWEARVPRGSQPQPAGRGKGTWGSACTPCPGDALLAPGPATRISHLAPNPGTAQMHNPNTPPQPRSLSPAQP